MDWLTFSSNVVDSLAWPIVSLILIYVLINKGSEISKIFKSIKYKDLEVSFRDELSKAKEISDNIKMSGRLLIRPEGKAVDTEEILKLADLDRSLAVFKIWQSLEAKVTQLIQHNGLVRFTNPTKFIDRLLQLGKIDNADVKLFNQLRTIRNEVVHLSPYGHEAKMTLAEVMEFKEFVDTFIARLETIRQEDDFVSVNDE